MVAVNNKELNKNNKKYYLQFVLKKAIWYL